MATGMAFPSLLHIAVKGTGFFLFALAEEEISEATFNKQREGTIHCLDKDIRSPQ